MMQRALWTLLCLVILCSLGMYEFGFKPESDSSRSAGSTSPALLTLLSRENNVPIGREFVAEVVLSAEAKSPVHIHISSSNPDIMVPVLREITIFAGQRSANLSYRGLAVGAAELVVDASGYPAQRLPLTVVPSSPTRSLREAAAQRNLLIGAAADADELGHPSPLQTDPTYASMLASQYNMLEPEGAMKWIVIHPQQDVYDFQPADELVSFARAHGMKVRGHNLCWGLNNPSWLNAYRNQPPAVVSQLLHKHIQTVVSHFRGQVFAWDVVNEAFASGSYFGDSRLQDSVWYNQPGIGRTGTGYIEQAFRWAHEADPSALLFYNDEITAPGAKLNAVYRMLTDFAARKVPLDGVGLQVHLRIDHGFDPADLAAVLDRITSLGLQVHITELDVALPLAWNGTPTSADLQRQARIYSDVLEVCLQNARCTAFQTWGFTDKHSWVPIYMPGFGAALPLDADYQSKPAYTALLRTLRGN